MVGGCAGFGSGAVSDGFTGELLEGFVMIMSGSYARLSKSLVSSRRVHVQVDLSPGFFFSFFFPPARCRLPAES